MQGLLWFLRLCLAALVLVAALVALPVSMAWSAAPTIQSLAGETRPQSWAEPLDERLNLYRIQPNLYPSVPCLIMRLNRCSKNWASRQ